MTRMENFHTMHRDKDYDVATIYAEDVVGHTYKAYEDFERFLPVFANLLECEVADLILYNRGLGGYATDNKYRDRPLKFISLINGGLDEGVPFMGNKFHSTNLCDKKGATLYEARNGVRYVGFCTMTPDGGNEYVLVLRKNEVYRFWRYVNAQNRKSEQFNSKLPILDDAFTKEIIDSTIGFLKKKKLFKSYGVRVKRGIIFAGSPGNGKTMLCRHIKALASHSNIDTNNIGAPHIEDYFSKDRLNACMNFNGILFIDDVDIAYFQKDLKGGKSNIASSLLSAMDGLDCQSNTVRIFTTNEDYSSMDPAFLRPGRIDKVFTFELPRHDLREKFIMSWHPDVVNYIVKEKQVDALVNATEGLSFAQIDLIKTNMVEHFILEGTWDMRAALDSANQRLIDIQSEAKRVGFGSKK